MLLEDGRTGGGKEQVVLLRLLPSLRNRALEKNIQFKPYNEKNAFCSSFYMLGVWYYTYDRIGWDGG